jgi:hypothetical protein
MTFKLNLSGTTSQVVIGEVQVDASTNEGHGLTGVVSSHPVESGQPITDHYSVDPDELTIEAVITKSPLKTGYPGQSAISSVGSLIDGKGGDPVLDAWAAIENYFKNSELITITTSLKTYTNMALVSFSVTRSADTGDALSFSLNARELRIVETATATALEDIQAKNARKAKSKTTQDKKNKGRKQKKKASKEQKKSVLAQMADGVGGLFK